jgi:UDP-N-acetylmuramate dehydrogenase
MAFAMKDDLRSAGFRGEILAEEPLAAYTTWRIGGPAELLASPADRDDLLSAIGWARSRGVPWRVLGNGSNLLVSDAGVRGLVVRLRKVLDDIRIDGTAVTAGGGASFPGLANRTARHGLAGLEFAAGIPGTVGAAIVMNAGWHEFETGNVVSTVEVLETDGTVGTCDRENCKFGYRSSAFRGSDRVVLGAEFRLKPDEPSAIQARLDGFAASRKANQPTELPSCGSVFLKPEGDFAGRLIESAGLKGRRIGDIQVSPKHANFFVNLGHGTATDALALVELVEAEVFKVSGVRLTREFEVW